MDCSPPGSSVHGISQGFPRQEYWSGLPFPIPGDLPSPAIEPMSIMWVSYIGRWILYHCTTWEAPHIALMTRQKLLQLSWKFWLICCIHQTVHHWISIYFRLYKILLMEKTAIPWKNIKGTWNSSLLKKIKSLGKPELWHCLKMAEGSGTKHTLFNKTLGENEKCLLFLLKIKGTFWSTQC